jgi:hypothetical protein
MLRGSEYSLLTAAPMTDLLDQETSLLNLPSQMLPDTHRAQRSDELNALITPIGDSLSDSSDALTDPTSRGLVMQGTIIHTASDGQLSISSSRRKPSLPDPEVASSTSRRGAREPISNAPAVSRAPVEASDGTPILILRSQSYSASHWQYPPNSPIISYPPLPDWQSRHQFVPGWLRTTPVANEQGVSRPSSSQHDIPAQITLPPAQQIDLTVYVLIF